ncbi:MAG: restriction endonuclease, partial [Acidimicrobiia bacterium]
AKEVFNGVEIKGGICYFLRVNDHDGFCKVKTVRDGVSTAPELRNLNEFDVFVRNSDSVKILRKVLTKVEDSITTILSVDKQFGWTSNFNNFQNKPKDGDVELHYLNKGKRSVGYIKRNEIKKSAELIDKWKVMVPKAGSDGGQRIPDSVVGKPHLAESPSVCTQTFLFFHTNTRTEAESIQSYYQTKFFRFLVSLRKITQDATRSTYMWVPIQKWDRIWTDEVLYEKYGLNKKEIDFIESMVRPMGVE